MTIQTNVEDRRALVRMISERLQTEAVYQRAPTYAYANGPVTIDRDGAITCDDDAALGLCIPVPSWALIHGQSPIFFEPRPQDDCPAANTRMWKGL